MLHIESPQISQDIVSLRLLNEAETSTDQALLFCFGYAGGSAEVYRQWQSKLANCAQIVPVELAGRGTLHSHPFCQSISQAAASAAEAISVRCTTQPYFLFGHSLGSIIALESARYLKELRGKQPDALFVSGRLPPHVITRKTHFHTATDEALVAELIRLGGTPEELLQDNNFMRFILPVIRDDFRLIETHSSSALPKIDMPIYVCSGNKDADAPAELLERWDDITTADSEVTIFNGGHFFLNSQQDAILTYIKKQIESYLI